MLVTVNEFERRSDALVRPSSVGVAARDIAVRTLAPGVLWLGVVVAVGRIIMHVFHGANGEDSINRTVQTWRTPFLDTATRYCSGAAATLPTCSMAVAGTLLVLYLTRKWWLAILPILAVGLQAGVFLLTTLVTDRPRPAVPHLDQAPPTSSYPSGHTGATTALYVMFALLAQRIPNAALRRVITAVCLLMPLLVGFSRIYRGMHHVSDVVMGLLNGLVCAFLAWRYLRPARGTTDS